MKIRKLLKNPIKKTDESVKIAFGKPVCSVTFKTIKFLTTISFTLIVLNMLYCLDLFSSAVHIKKSLGDFINMISKGDGHVLPTLQAVPTLMFLVLDIVFIYFVFKLFHTEKQPKINWILFIIIVADIVIIFITFIFIIYILSHSYSSHEKLHDGITKAMSNYSSNSFYKVKIDRLQIELDCCGSKKYDEWYTIKWYDEKLTKSKAKDNSQGNTPFSCCSITSIFPCIHHNIENTGRAYLYTPEQNLSISTEGCYHKIRDKKKIVGWKIAGNLFLMQVFQVSIIIFVRFIQTGHYVDSKFFGHKKSYTIWLFGMYVGKKKDENEKSGDDEKNASAPEPPPVPSELKK